MDPREIANIETEVSDLMKTRLGIKAPTLQGQTRKAQKRLPRKLRRAAQELSESSALATHPKLSRMIDQTNATRNAKALRKHLGSIDTAGRKRKRRLGIAASLMFNLLVLSGVILGVLVWRGLI